MKRIEYSESARKFLLKCNKNLSKRIINKIDFLTTSHQQLEVKKLKGKENLHRIRVGDYRIIFENIKDTIFISKIGHRKDIYK